MTKTAHQWWEGGYLCSNCGRESDLAGNPVLRGVAPQHQIISTSVAMLVSAVIPAVVLLLVILNR